MPRDLSRLFHPRSVAVIGGGAWGTSVVKQCAKMGFPGPVWPVHPRKSEIGGLPTVPRIEDLPQPPDAAFVAINREAAVEAVRLLAESGAGGAVCFASGFAEAAGELDGAAEAQSRIVAAAGEMPLLGPNCYGLLNYLDGVALWPDEHGGRHRETGVAIVAQSSNMLINLTMTPALPIAFCVAAGNQAHTSQAAIAGALLEDPRVTAIGLHVEGVGDIRAWERFAARARARQVPVVALKVGRSEAAQAGTLSHTASLAGPHSGAEAFFDRLGIGLVHSLPELVAALGFLHVHGSIGGARVASLSCSGGEASLLADMAEPRAVTLPRLPKAARDRLAAVLGAKVTLGNPLDYHTYIWGDAAAMTETYAAVLSGGGYDAALLLLDLPREDRCSPAPWDCALQAIRAAKARAVMPVAVVSTLPAGLPETVSEALMADGIAALNGIGEALAAIEAAAAIGEAERRPEPAGICPAPALEGPARLLDEVEAKAALAAHGLAVPKGSPAATPEEAAAVAAKLGAGPFALKRLGLAHKTEAGAVRLGLAAAAVGPEAAVMGTGPFLVEHMVADGVAELLVGITRDPAHGLTLTLGAGGTLTELLADTATLLLPTTEAAIEAALAGLRVAKLLAGHRGKPPGDLAATVAAIRAVEAYALAEVHRLVELDVNPLIVTPSAAWAADALIRLAELRSGDPA